MKTKKFISLLFWVCLFLGNSSSAQEKNYAPDFTLEDLQGNRVSLSDFKGKVVVLDFWATWCRPCMMEIPQLDKFYTEYKDNGLEVIGVALDRDPEVVSRFIKNLGTSYLVLMGNQTVARIYGAQAIPTTYILDRVQIARFRHVGFHPLKTAWALEKEITTLLAEKVEETREQAEKETREKKQVESTRAPEEQKSRRVEDQRDRISEYQSTRTSEEVAQKAGRKNLVITVPVLVGLGVFVWLKSRKPITDKFKHR